MTCAKTYAAAALSALFLFLLAPAALAQSLPEVGQTTDTVGDTIGAIEDTTKDTTDTIGGTTGGTTDTIQDTTDTIGGTTGGTTDTIEDTTKDTTDTIGGTTGGTTDTIQDTTKDTTDTVGGTTGGTTDTVGGITGGDGSGSTGGGGGIPPVEDLAPGVISEILDEAETLGLSPEAAEGWIEGKKILESASFETPRAALSSFARVLESLLGTVAQAGTAASPNVALSVEPQGESFFESAGRIATEAAKTLAFPLALALAVVGFLTVQGRIGRKDPKLALAPVDTTEETLIFE